MKYYSMADLNFGIEGIEHCTNAILQMSEYEVSKPDKTDVTISFVQREFIPIPDDVEIVAKLLARVYVRNETGYGVYTVLDESDGALLYISYDKTWSKITVRTSKRDHMPVEQGEKCSNILWEIVRNVLIAFHGTVLHSSAISYEGEGILFSAPSGTGKSTHTALWQKLYHDQVILINDDTPAVRFVGDSLYVYGLPWSGSGSNRNVRVPLKAVVFLERAEENKIYATNIITAIYNMTDEIYKPIYSDMMDTVINTVEKILGKALILTIECNMGDNAAIMAKNKVFCDI